MKNITYENKSELFKFEMQKYLSPLPHLHKEIEIVYVMDGCSYAFADRKSEVIGTGDLFIAFPNQIHYYEASVTGEYLVLIFSPDVLFEIKSLMYNNLPDKNFLHNMLYSDATELLLKAWKTEGDYSRTAVVGILNEMVALLLQQIDIKSRIKTDNSTLQSVLNYCSQNFSSELTLDTVADALHISKYHISHLLNNKLGIGFNYYLNTVRINAACDLLEDTDKKIADISEEVGFGSIRSFNRAFSQIMNISPLRYRDKFSTP
ncbi:MAG: AraC family transcriptional regulator [Clostridia bacterium]|nr:AraC family transcriptional regulator [Clostridia bacterium]